MKTTQIPRPEYPRMQFRREQSWMNLNGVWNFSIDYGKTGIERGLPSNPKLFDRQILVPFCPESKLSGIEHKDFMESVFYQRTVTFPKAWAGKRIFLNFGGVDFESAVYIDGNLVTTHTGGSCPFSVDVTNAVTPGKKHSLVVHALDNLRSGEQGGGKQCVNFYSASCSYTRTTGIWQTVWAEAVDPAGLASCVITPEFDASQVVFTPSFIAAKAGDKFRVVVRSGSKVVAEKVLPAATGASAVLDIPNMREWNPADPFLYDATLTVERDGQGILDSVETYFAMRKVSCAGGRILLNNKPIYLRMVLDQGFYPTGVWTAPSDRELKADIKRSMDMGFNGARLHQKVFEDRFHYWADRLGYLTWSEFPSWVSNPISKVAHANFLAEWTALVAYLRNHPSIIAWTPMNETGFSIPNLGNAGNMRIYRDFARTICALTRAIDPTRPVNDASGHIHVDTDLWTVHSYRATPEEQKECLLPKDSPVWHTFKEDSGYNGQPYLVDEWGGYRYLRPEDRKNDTGWGYNGLKFEDPKAFLAQIRPQAELFASLPQLSGHCYTQLTDVEQEQNGMYTYARKPKVDPKEAYKVFSIKPSWSAW